MNLSDLRQHVRDLTGVYSSDVVSDALINRWINESYNEVSRERDWDWLESSYSATVPAAVAGVHTVNLANGSRRVISAYIVNSNGSVEEMINTPNFDHVEPDTPKVYYDVNFSGVFQFTPEQPDDYTVKVHYSQAGVELATDTDVPAFDAQFHSLLAYRAAVSVLQFLSDDTKRSEFFMSEYSSLMSGMYSLYELDHDSRTFQLGEDGVNTRKYFPWFKPA